MIELCVTVILLGLGVVSVVSLLFAVTVSASSNRRAIRTVNSATAIAEAIDAMPYEACTASNPPTYASKVPAGLLSSGDSVTYAYSYQRDPSDPKNPVASYGSCPGSDLGTQKIKVTVKVTRATTQRSVTIIKRDETCPPLVSVALC